MAGGEGAAGDEAGAAGELGAADSGEQGGGGDVDAGVDEGRFDAFGEVFEQVGGFGAGGRAGVEAVDFVDEDQADASLGVGVADGAGDLGLGHAGGDGDAEVAGEFGGEGFRGGAGWHQQVRDRHLAVGAAGRGHSGSAACASGHGASAAVRARGLVGLGVEPAAAVGAECGRVFTS